MNQSLPPHIIQNIEVDANGCWLWTRSRNPDGYGWASLNNKTFQAHRLVYLLIKGDVEQGLALDHLCRVRHCVNPDHLEPVSPAENLKRSTITPSGSARCLRCGGQFSWIGQTKPQRRCKECCREWRREYARAYRRGERRRSA